MNNTVKRSIFGTVFLVIMVGCLLLGNLTHGLTFGALMLFVVVASLLEFFRMTLHGRYKGSQTLAIIAGVALYVGGFAICAFHLSGKYLILAFIPLFVLFCNALYTRDPEVEMQKSEDGNVYKIVDFGAFAYFFTAIVYIVLPFMFFNFLVFNKQGVYDAYPLLCVFALVWAGDVGGYCFGLTVGKYLYKKKLFPEISPKKSWAGFWGGLALTIAVSVGLSHFGIFEIHGTVLPWYHAIGIAIAVNITGVYGDLIESQWKRFSKVKDSGSIIPGHGGILDRFDSSMMAIPMAIVYLIIIGLI